MLRKALCITLFIMTLMLHMNVSAQTEYVFTPQNNLVMPILIHDLQNLNNENVEEIIELAEFQYFNELGTSVPARNFALSPDGSLLAFSLYYRDEANNIVDETTIVIADVATGTELARLRLNIEDPLSENLLFMFGLYFSPDSSRFFAWAGDGGAMWDITQIRDTGEVALLSSSNNSSIRGLFFGDDGVPYWIVNRSAPRLENVSTNQDVDGWRSGIVMDNYLVGFQGSENGEIYALYPNSDNDLIVVYNQTGDELISIEKRGIYGTFDISPDGHYIAVSQPEDQTIEIWDIETHDLAYVLENSTDAYDVLRFSLDGRWLIARVQINGRWVARLFAVSNWELFFESENTLQYHSVAGTMNQQMTISVDGFDEGENGFRLYGIPHCAVRASRDINMRDGAGTNFDAVEVLPADALGFVDGQTTGDDGLIWWHLTNGLYVREDTVDELGTDCAGISEM